MDWCAPSRRGKDATENQDPWNLSIGSWWSQPEATHETDRKLDKAVVQPYSTAQPLSQQSLDPKAASGEEQTGTAYATNSEGTISMKDGAVIVQASSEIL
jgi:hypothetical protein